MKPRVQLIRETLYQILPENFLLAIEILRNSIAESGDFKNFNLWPYSDYIQTYGHAHPQLALEQLKIMTSLFTSEFAVRPYLRLYPDLTLSYLQDCAADDNVHIRRWASEGSRPRLPWGERLQNLIQAPTLSLGILEKLKFDPELYVRKSVANHLNDIAKDHPLLVIQILRRWQKEAGEKHATNINWIIHRALRTLIKSGHDEALFLIGVGKSTKIKLSRFKINQKKFRLGDRLEFSFQISSQKKISQNLVVDYIMHFQRANGKTTPKVFKLKTLQIDGGGSIQLTKAHVLKKVSTRSYYSGRQFLEIQINGLIYHRVAWNLDID